MTPTETERAALDAVIDRALELHAGAPVFTASVLHRGEVFGPHANEVGETRDPSRHAEIVAIARAGAALGTTDLSEATLIASMQPCEMCLAAMRWAGISRLVFAMTQTRAPTFFQFPALGIDDFARAADNSFTWSGGHGADRLSQIYEGT
ncbi:Guanine deaminase [Roseivivax jejudonensis]|uniref:Guanine deaminase n=1 Tax=Roseivivax jejudonensis TaxID=1529041 RepID=A0A1X6YHS2_9RHOB|nr:nucleoside deaminase [Roseivivax jejudonensis]SLN21563.1 Guanine deaminase [Roseivivax jejudonensis]